MRVLTSPPKRGLRPPGLEPVISCALDEVPLEPRSDGAPVLVERGVVKSPGIEAGGGFDCVLQSLGDPFSRERIVGGRRVADREPAGSGQSLEPAGARLPHAHPALEAKAPRALAAMSPATHPPH